MKQRNYLGKWKNEKVEQEYRRLDAEAWERATDTPPEAIDTATSFGSTRTYRWPGAGPPVVFLHGMGDTSIRWIPFAERLEEYDVYAIDIMGDVGASEHEVAFESAADYSDWLEQTIAGLGLTTPHLVGHSLGGYVALAYAMGPNRVASTIVFDPVGVVKLRLVRFMAWGFGAGLASFTPGPIRRMLARRLRFPLIVDKPGMRLHIHGHRHHPMSLPPLPVFTDEELASISDPLQVLIGAESTIFDVERLVERINTTVATGEARAVPDAGHALTMTHFDECVVAIRSALAAQTCAN